MDFLKGIRVAGTGSHLPDETLDNKFFANEGPYWEYLGESSDGSPIWKRDKQGIVEQEITEQRIVSLSGIIERRRAAPDENVIDLARESLTNALEDAGLDALDLEGIICASVTQPYRSCSMACMLQDELGAKNVRYARDISAGCAGFVHALNDLKAVMQLDGLSPVAVIGAETLTRHTDRDRNRFLFGDGAGSVIFETTDVPGYENFVVVYGSQACGGKSKALFIDKGGVVRMPQNREVFKLGSEQMISMAAKAKLAYAKLTGMSLDAVNGLVKLYIPHQANLRMIRLIENKVGTGKVFINIEKYGNTSAATIPIAIDEAIKAGKLLTGDLVVTPSFGAGFAIAAALFKI